MTKSLRSAAVLAVALSVLAPVVPTRADIVITEAMPNSRVTGDWFEVTNTGPAAVDLTGYRMDDNSFSSALSVLLNGVSTLPAGQSAVFLEIGTGDPATDVANYRAFWGGAATTGLIGYYLGSGAGVGLSATADGVALFNAASAEVTRISFGAATTGSSFYGTSGAPGVATVFTNVSVAGQNGAYNSVGVNATSSLPDVGSPNVNAVPEPTTWAALTMGAMLGGFALVRRRRMA